MTERERDERDAALILTDALAAARARLADGADQDTGTYLMAVFVTLAAGALFPQALRDGAATGRPRKKSRPRRRFSGRTATRRPANR